MTTDTTRIIHLIRHGETNWNRERRAQGQQDSVLTEAGILQARELGAAMADVPLEAIYVSSSLRTRQTADLAFSQRAIPMQVCDLLREIHMGPWEGRLYEDIRQGDPDQFHAFWHEPHRFSLPGAETFLQVQQRALTRLQQILAESTARHIAIVSHGVVIKSILCAYEPRPLSELWAPPAMHNCSRSELRIHPDASVRITRYSDLPYPTVQEESA